LSWLELGFEGSLLEVEFEAFFSGSPFAVLAIPDGTFSIP
jgi:hypothetical protein